MMADYSPTYPVSIRDAQWHVEGLKWCAARRVRGGSTRPDLIEDARRVSTHHERTFMLSPFVLYNMLELYVSDSSESLSKDPP